MGVIILVLLIVVPMIEIAVFIGVGGEIGLINTLAVVVATAVLGTYLLRRQGLSTLFRMQQTLDENRLPVRELFDGLCLLVAGALLLTPGFVTDGMGFLLFLPAFRSYAAGVLARYVVARGHIRMATGDGTAHGFGRPPGSGDVIDGEFEDVTAAEPGAEQPGRDAPRRLPED